MALPRYWYDNGQKKSDLTYKDGRFDGTLKWWYEDGQIQGIIHYKNNRKDGSMEGWYSNGQKREEVLYKEGNLISERKWDKDGNEE